MDASQGADGLLDNPFSVNLLALAISQQGDCEHGELMVPRCVYIM